MDIIFVVDIIGTVAFAVSGAMVAIEKDLDYYGIVFLSLITATGGGIVRDLLLGNVPLLLSQPVYALLSSLSAMLVIAFYRDIARHTRTLQFFDALGLAAFTVIGAECAINSGLGNLFAVVTMAVLTGTGGGAFRDVFSREIPYVFRKEIYAVASIIGATVFYACKGIAPEVITVYLSFGVTLAIRLLSLGLDLHLKHVEIQE